MTTLRHGDRSQAVLILQKNLNRHGDNLKPDGDYGDITEAAVRAYQLKTGLVADGIAGSKAQISLAGGDCAKLLRNNDLIAAAERLDVPLASIYAVNEVESRGRGFLDNGKPVILFERHIMHRQLAKALNAGDDPAELKRKADQLAITHPALVNPKAGGYIGGTAEHQRLAMARHCRAGVGIMGRLPDHGLSLAAPRLQQRAGLRDDNEYQRITAVRGLHPVHRNRRSATQSPEKP